MADERRQWQILTNLLSNAVKFSDADQPIQVEVRRDNGGARVSVVDRGRGIGPESMRHLFKKFSRLPDPEGAKKPPGTGLGLYICDLLVRAQGGQIWAESTPGGGSTFTYTIPSASRPSPPRFPRRHGRARHDSLGVTAEPVTIPSA